MRGIFITGSDTAVGKTTFATQLITQLKMKHVDVFARKPIESGCHFDHQTGKLIANDAKSIAEAINDPESASTICPYRFVEAISPARAASLNNIQLTIDDLYNVCKCSDDKFAVIEGAGGLLSPLAHQCSNADLAKKLGLPLILIVADKLGCINHALLSLATAQSMGIEVLAVLINRFATDAPTTDMNNLSDLEELCDVPLFKMQDIRMPDSKLYQHIVNHAV